MYNYKVVQSYDDYKVEKRKRYSKYLNCACSVPQRVASVLKLSPWNSINLYDVVPLQRRVNSYWNSVSLTSSLKLNLIQTPFGAVMGKVFSRQIRCLHTLFIFWFIVGYIGHAHYLYNLLASRYRCTDWVMSFLSNSSFVFSLLIFSPIPNW